MDEGEKTAVRDSAPANVAAGQATWRASRLHELAPALLVYSVACSTPTHPPSGVCYTHQRHAPAANAGNMYWRIAVKSEKCPMRLETTLKTNLVPQ